MVERGFFGVKKLVNKRIGGRKGFLELGKGWMGSRTMGGSGRGLPFVEGVWFGDGDSKCGLV